MRMSRNNQARWGWAGCWRDEAAAGSSVGAAGGGGCDSGRRGGGTRLRRRGGTGAHRGGDPAGAGLLEGGAVREAAGRGGDGVQEVQPGLVLPALGQYELRARARFPHRQRHLPQGLGVRAGLDPVVGRAGAAVQRAVLPALSSEGRARPSARAGRAGRIDDPQALRRARRPRPGLWRPAAEFLRPGHPGRGRDDHRLRGNARNPGRRRDGESPQTHLRDRRPRLRPARPRHAAVAPRRPAGDRDGAARSDPGSRHPRRRRPRRPRRRRHLGPPQPGVERRAQEDDARPLRLEGRPAHRRPAGRRRVPGRCRHRHPALPPTPGATAPRRSRPAGRRRMAEPPSRPTSRWKRR